MKTSAALGVPVLVLILLGGLSAAAVAQPPGFGPPPQPEVIPDPVVAPIPAIAPLADGGKVYDSSAALWADRGIEYFDYVIDEYKISGTAAGQPYETRLVIRKPKDDSKFSGLVVAEAMHPAGAAHAFEYNSLYIMSEGHGRHHCRNCEALFDQMRERCRVCLKPQSLCCVRCLMPMEMLEIAGVALDVCRTCRLVWFDRGELGLLLRRHAGALQQGLTHRPRAGLASQVGRSVLHHPDALSGGFELARVGVEVTGHVVTEGGASAVVEVATSAGEAAVELSAGALEVLAGILSDVF